MVSKTATAKEKRAAAEYQQKWRAKNYERWREISNASQRKYKTSNFSKVREQKREHRYAVRREILDLLGGQKCTHCGYDKDWRALQIDHVRAGGKKDIRTNSGNTGLWAFRNWLKKVPGRHIGIYQVLCANCNWIKCRENAEGSIGRIRKHE